MTYPTAPPDMAHFELALKDPFAAGAVGARVCDSYMIPTATYHLRTAVGVTSSASGQVSCIVLPSPALTLIASTIANSGTYTGLSSFTNNTQGVGFSGAFYLTSPSTLSQVLSEYRVVSWGLRILAKDTATGTKGKVYVATVPTTENVPAWNIFQAVTADANSMGLYTVGIAESQLASIVNLPGVRCFSMQDLLRGEVLINGTPSHSEFYCFKNTIDSLGTQWSSNNGTVLADDAAYSTTTKTLVNSTSLGRKDPASLRGGRAVLIYATGLPASTNEFDMELVYHLEGTPFVGTAASLVPSSIRSTSGSTALVEKAIAVASTAKALFRYVRDPLNQAAGMRALQFLGL